MPADYTCAECARPMCLLTADAPPSAGLCAACTFCPGWFRDPGLRLILDPDHDGIERVERLATSFGTEAAPWGIG